MGPAGPIVESNCSTVHESGSTPVHDVVAPPVGVVAVSDDDVGGFDVPPLRYGIPWGCSAMLREKPT